MELWDERNQRGQALLEEGRLEDAEVAFRSAIEVGPTRPEPWFNLGLSYKWRHRWDDCLRANLTSAELVQAGGWELREEAACWNLGIAASAVGAWDIARWAWRSFGLEIPDGDGPPAANFGPGFVRINPATGGEVVFGNRLDPARLRIGSVPLPGSGHRFGDVVLHDGEPKGRRIVEETDFAVFDELERLEPSPIPTRELDVWCAEPSDVEALLAAADRLGRAEDWTASVQMICNACSTGEEGVRHDHDRLHTSWAPERSIGLAAPDDDVDDLLDHWVGAAPKDRIVRAVSPGS